MWLCFSWQEEKLRSHTSTQEKQKEHTSSYTLMPKCFCCDPNVYNLGFVKGNTKAKIQATHDKL